MLWLKTRTRTADPRKTISHNSAQAIETLLSRLRPLPEPLRHQRFWQGETKLCNFARFNPSPMEEKMKGKNPWMLVKDLPRYSPDTIPSGYTTFQGWAQEGDPESPREGKMYLRVFEATSWDGLGSMEYAIASYYQRPCPG